MNFAFMVASLLLNTSILTDAIRCYQCIERSWNDCQQRQKENACNDPTLLGNSHCFSASGKYDNGTAILDVMARGCIDCSDKKKACDSLKLVLAYTVNSKPLGCDIDCCTGTLCNTRVPQPTNASRQQEPTVKTVKMSDGVTRHSLHVGLLMMVGYLSLVLL
ncbi:uncharacterized skeletal organic matrix protein 2-like [Porites lutea]|uniref:uncharacterized skeletal organic matrix protein 2-like n=1 Tax=Porites lutea TaxID=51062 RepID=UPI003CC50A4C